MARSPDSLVRFEEITTIQRRRRWALEERRRIVAETYLPGATVAEVARRNGVAPNQVFTWRKQLAAAREDANLDAADITNLSDAVRRIRLLERLLGQKTLEIEVLKEQLAAATARRPPNL